MKIDWEEIKAKFSDVISDLLYYLKLPQDPTELFLSFLKGIEKHPLIGGIIILLALSIVLGVLKLVITLLKFLIATLAETVTIKVLRTKKAYFDDKNKRDDHFPDSDPDDFYKL